MLPPTSTGEFHASSFTRALSCFGEVCRAYPTAALLAVCFLLLRTALRAALTAQSWRGARLSPGSAAEVPGIGLIFDLVTLALLLPRGRLLPHVDLSAP